jgi:hypothetical protein
MSEVEDKFSSIMEDLRQHQVREEEVLKQQVELLDTMSKSLDRTPLPLIRPWHMITTLVGFLILLGSLWTIALQLPWVTKSDQIAQAELFDNRLKASFDLSRQNAQQIHELGVTVNQLSVSLAGVAAEQVEHDKEIERSIGRR